MSRRIMRPYASHPPARLYSAGPADDLMVHPQHVALGLSGGYRHLPLYASGESMVGDSPSPTLVGLDFTLPDEAVEDMAADSPTTWNEELYRSLLNMRYAEELASRSPEDADEVYAMELTIEVPLEVLDPTPIYCR